MAKYSRWAVCLTTTGAVSVGIEPIYDTVGQLDKLLGAGSYTVCHLYASEAEGLAAVERAKSMERLIRPFWQLAIEEEQRVRCMMQDASIKAAQPLQVG